MRELLSFIMARVGHRREASKRAKVTLSFFSTIDTSLLSLFAKTHA
jgi:hypothetical protein